MILLVENNKFRSDIDWISLNEKAITFQLYIFRVISLAPDDKFTGDRQTTQPGLVPLFPGDKPLRDHNKAIWSN